MGKSRRKEEMEEESYMDKPHKSKPKGMSVRGGKRTDKNKK